MSSCSDSACDASSSAVEESSSEAAAPRWVTWSTEAMAWSICRTPVACSSLAAATSCTSPAVFWIEATSPAMRRPVRSATSTLELASAPTSDAAPWARRAIFDRHQRRKIVALRLRERRRFEIPNPFLGPETPFADKRLWFDPATYR